MKIQSNIRITPAQICLNGQAVPADTIEGLYRKYVGDYSKFFKMDALCKLGLVASEMLLKDVPCEEKENAAIVLFNRNGSLITDRNYQKTIAADNYFPSPSLFVYTLANIVEGEIAIRHKIQGETMFYILPEYDEARMEEVVNQTKLTSAPSFVLAGWVDYDSESDYLADLKLYKEK